MYYDAGAWAGAGMIIPYVALASALAEVGIATWIQLPVYRE